jgi:hypothetical protein
MSVSLSNSQFAWFSRWNGFHANGVASPYQGEGEGEGLLVRAPKTPHLSPLPLLKGRSENGRRICFSFATLTINECSRS